jgi:thioredoxin reductase (NADPH)
MPFVADAGLVWTGALALTSLIVGLYAAAFRRRGRRDEERLVEAVRLGIDKPTAQAPLIDPTRCIGCGSCVTACPEGDVLGIVGGIAVVINGVRCVGHGLCEEACPVGALTVTLADLSGREDVPLLDEWGESSVRGVYVVGDLSGMSLIRNAAFQGRRVADRIAAQRAASHSEERVLDVAIVGSGPAGLTVALGAMENGLSCRLFEQEESLGGTILHYPQKKLVLTQPVELPLGHRIHRQEYAREELLALFQGLVDQHRLDVRFGERVQDVTREEGLFRIQTPSGEHLTRTLVLATGRRGTPRRLGVPGEELSKVRYQLRDALSYRERKILVVGGGDSAVEAAMALAQADNEVVLSYRRDRFVRIKKKNELALAKTLRGTCLRTALPSQVVEIKERSLVLETAGERCEIANDDVFVLIGSEPALPLLRRLGLRFGGGGQ